MSLRVRHAALLALMSVGASPLQAQMWTPTLDANWGYGGKQAIWFDLPTEKWDEATDAVVQADGKIVVVGFARKAPLGGGGDVSDLTVTRLSANGLLDPTFASSGKLSANFGSGGRSADVANGVALDASGRIYVAGYTETGYGYCGIVVRYGNNGVLDSSYGNAGKALLCDGNGAGIVYHDIAIDAQGRAVIAATKLRSSGALNDGLAVRLTPQGLTDTSFTGGTDSGNSIGLRTLTLSWGAAFDDEVKRVAILANGDILMAGSTRTSGNDYDFMVYKLNGTNGALVPSFGGGGKAQLYMNSWAAGTTADKYDRLSDMAVLPDGRTRLLGNCRWAYTGTLRPCLIGATASGTYDAGFAGNVSGKVGVRSFVLEGEANNVTGSEANSVAYRTDGLLLVAGSSFWQSPMRMVMARHYDSGTGSSYGYAYTAYGSWVNKVLLSQSQAVLIGGAVLDALATDTDQATVRFTGL